MQQFLGVFTTVELQFAVETQGAQILKIYEVYHYPNKSKRVFVDYIDACLKRKITSSKIPPGISQSEYLAEWEKKEGIAIKPDEMVYSAPRRMTSKLLLNALWG